MNDSKKREVIEALEAYMQLHGLSANEISAQTGINSSYISHMRSESTTIKVGDKEVEIQNKYYEQLARLCGYELEKSYWSPKKTDQIIRMMATLEDARAYGYTNLIIGETGCGKTFSANLFAKQYPKDFYIVTVGSQDFINDMLTKLIKTLKVKTTAVSKSRRLEAIVEHLKSIKLKGYRPVIYFDESEYMKSSMLTSMKELYDNLHGVCGIVMGGTDQFIKNLEKLRRKNKDGMPQFYRRIKFGIRYLPAIDRSFKAFIGEYDKPLQRFLRENCDNYGELHDVLVPALREADRTGVEINEEFIKVVLGIQN